MKKLSEFKTNETEMIIESYSEEIFNLIKNGNDIDESFLGTLIGGTAGVLLGPIIGRTLARVLGVEKGLLYNLLTSKMVTGAIGAAILNQKM